MWLCHLRRHLSHRGTNLRQSKWFVSVFSAASGTRQPFYWYCELSRIIFPWLLSIFVTNVIPEKECCFALNERRRPRMCATLFAQGHNSRINVLTPKWRADMRYFLFIRRRLHYVNCFARAHANSAFNGIRYSFSSHDSIFFGFLLCSH